MLDDWRAAVTDGNGVCAAIRGKRNNLQSGRNFFVGKICVASNAMSRASAGDTDKAVVWALARSSTHAVL